MIPTIYFDFFNPEATPQVVYIRVQNDPLWTRDLIQQWPVNKVLTARDLCGDQVVIPRAQVEKYIIPQLLPKEKEWVISGQPLEITVRDLETLMEHRSWMFLINGSSSYVLTGGWNCSFIRRRGLQVGDQIGICWDQRLQLLRFAILNRPPVPRQQ